MLLKFSPCNTSFLAVVQNMSLATELFLVSAFVDLLL